MASSRRAGLSSAALAGALGLAAVLAACGGTAITPSPFPTASATPAGTVVVRWMVPRGTGSAVVPPYVDFARRYNDAGHSIHVNLEIVPSVNAYDVLKSELAAGNAPDVVGPIGERWLTGLGDLLLDQSPEWAAHSGHDPTVRYDAAQAGLFKGKDGATIGAPYLIYPAFMFYNKALFQAAGLPYPPHRVGVPFRNEPWDWNTAAALAIELTLDSKGKHPGELGFDANKIVQYGLDFQWWDARRMASAFGAGSFVAPDGRTAQIPAQWSQAWHWYHDAMYTYHFAATSGAAVLQCLGCASMPMAAMGNVAMNAANTWYLGSLLSGPKARVRSWDIAVLPSWNGQTSGPLDVDSFSILKGTAHLEEAFHVMGSIMADKGLQEWLGGMPAEGSARAAWFAKQQAQVDEVFPGNKVDWSVLQEMATHPAVPSHDADMPAVDQAIKLYGDFYARLQGQPEFNVDAELAKLKADLQKAFDQAAASPSTGS